MKRFFTSCLILCLALVLLLCSCGGGAISATTVPSQTNGEQATATDGIRTTEAEDKGTTANVETDPITEATTATPTTDKWEPISEAFAALDAEKKTIRIEMDSNVTAEKRARNDYYLAGPDEINSATPTIQQMIYQRNEAAKSLLGINIEYSYWDKGWGQQTSQIKTVVQGKAEDAPDLFVNMVYDLGNALLFSSFRDIYSGSDSYFDFSSEGWLTDYMDSMSLTHDRGYILAGDYFLDILRVVCVVPFNVDMMDENASKLSSFITTETLGLGEALSDYFFDFVEEGNWTYSVLTDLCNAIWQDVGTTAGSDDFGDVLGFTGDTSSKMASAMYLYSCGLNFFTEQIDESTGKLTISYLPDSSVLGDVFDAVSTLYAGKGTVVTTGGNKSSSAENPGIANHKIKFAEGTILFVGGNLLGSLEDDEYQSMTSVFSVVPLPKVHVSDSYVSLIHNDADAGAINVNTEKFSAVSAYIQYCTENSADIREEFLQVVTKYKTTRYNQGTDRMLDLIYDHITSARDKMIEDAVSSYGGPSGDRWHAILDAGKFSTDAAALAEKYQSAVANKQSVLNQIVDVWYTLPKIQDAE